MTKWGRVQQMFGFGPSADHIVDHALARSRAVSAKADHINSVLAPYLDAPNPFEAFAVDIFENAQEARLHRGERP